MVDSSDRLALEAETRSGNLFVVAEVVVAPGSVGVETLLDQQLHGEEANGLLGLTPDTNPAHALLGATIGPVASLGAMYSGTIDSPPSPSTRVEVAFEAATSGGATTLVEAITDEQPQSGQKQASSPFPALSLVDELLDTLAWPTGV